MWPATTLGSVLHCSLLGHQLLQGDGCPCGGSREKAGQGSAGEETLACQGFCGQDRLGWPGSPCVGLTQCKQAADRWASVAGAGEGGPVAMGRMEASTQRMGG